LLPGLFAADAATPSPRGPMRWLCSKHGIIAHR
jgi:hypothetical protein